MKPWELAFPVQGGKTWTPTEAEVIAWRAQLPGIDVDAEIAKACLWAEANPKKKDAKRFLVNWLLRAKPMPGAIPRQQMPKREFGGQFAAYQRRKDAGEVG